MDQTLYTTDETRPITSKSVARDEAVSMWGGLMGGVFVAVATLVLLGEIGMAIGLSAFEPGDRVAPYVVGAGIYGLFAAIVAFFVGGLASSYLSRTQFFKRGVLQGALVWAVAVPVIGFLGAMIAIGTSTAAAATAAAAAAATARDPVAARTTAIEADRAATEASRPENVDKAKKAAAGAGWTMVAGLLLSLGAAAAGGRVGTRRRHLHLRADQDRVVEVA